MKKLSNAVTNFINDEEGLTTVEYAVAGALIVGALVTAFSQLGDAVKGQIDSIKGNITAG